MFIYTDIVEFYPEYNHGHDPRKLYKLHIQVALDGSETSKELFWMIHRVVWLINGGKIAANYAQD